MKTTVSKYLFWGVMALMLFWAFDYAMDQDAKQMCDRLGDAAGPGVCEQAYGR